MGLFDPPPRLSKPTCALEAFWSHPRARLIYAVNMALWLLVGVGLILGVLFIRWLVLRGDNSFWPAWGGKFVVVVGLTGLWLGNRFSRYILRVLLK